MNTVNPIPRCVVCGNVFPDCHCAPESTPQIHTSSPKKPKCPECAGDHEPSGARSDCIDHWKKLAVAAIDLVEWARALLCNATPNSKFLDEEQQQCYCRGFGKWLSESNTLPLLAHDWGTAKALFDWLGAGTYRHVMQRHNKVFRASDESCGRYVDADSMPLLVDALLDWPAEGQEPAGWCVNPEWVRLGETRHKL